MQLELNWIESNYYNKQTNNKQTEISSEYKKNNIKKTKQNTEKKWAGWLVLGF